MTANDRVGILGAMQSEVRGLVSAMQVDGTGFTAGFEYWTGLLSGCEVVVARSGMGKVSAAAGMQRLIDEWRVGRVVVCGLAGGLDPGLEIGDIVIGERFIQHDLDASPIFPRFEVPGLGITSFAASPELVETAVAAAADVIREREASRLETGRHVARGLIVTGDQFIKDDKNGEIRRDLPEALCVEMEGGAIAQVCYMNEVPFVVVRIISDTADHRAPADFKRFVEFEAPAYTVSIVRNLLSRLAGESSQA